ncbi:MAG: hypothetical protein LBJ35_06545 [Spirochaetaceae bacterium]|jgi:hypothetical protein|nr:hypothetical protein [Spirochaetaceae bacterium]
MKMKTPLTAILPLLFISGLQLNAMGGSPPASEMEDAEYIKNNGKRIKVSGTARLVGSMPFTEIVITSDGVDWFIDKDEQDKFSGYEGKTVTVSGIARYNNLVLANGEKAGIKHTLTNIKEIR